LGNQTDKNFTVCVCCHLGIGQNLLDSIDNSFNEFNINYKILKFSGRGWNKELSSCFENDKYILSRIDSDDAVSPLYCQNIKTFFSDPCNLDKNNPVVFDYERLYYYNSKTEQSLSSKYTIPTNFISCINYGGVNPYTYPHPRFNKYYKVYKSKQSDACRIFHDHQIAAVGTDWDDLSKGKIRQDWRTETPSELKKWWKRRESNPRL